MIRLAARVQNHDDIPVARKLFSSQTRTCKIIPGSGFKVILGLIVGWLTFHSWQMARHVPSPSSPKQEHLGMLRRHDDMGEATTTTDSSVGLLERVAYYKRRYTYHPPDANATTVAIERNRHCGTAPNYTHFFSLDYRHHSRFHEDKIIYDVFFKDVDADNNHNIQKRNYIELGAYNGKAESNTRFFDLCLGWKGLLIEGNPSQEIWGRLVKNRKRAHRMNYIPCCNETEQSANKSITFHPVTNTNAGIEVTGVQTEYSGHPYTVEVPCGTLTQVLVDLFSQNNKGIAFFSLDVEGSEHLVLNNIDFDKIPRIEVLMVEVTNRFCADGCAARIKTRQVLQAAGYVRFSLKIQASDVFVHRDSTNLLARARTAGWTESA